MVPYQQHEGGTIYNTTCSVIYKTVIGSQLWFPIKVFKKKKIIKTRRKTIMYMSEFEHEKNYKLEGLYKLSLYVM